MFLTLIRWRGLLSDIVSIVQNRISPQKALGETGIELLLEVRDADDIVQIRKGLAEHGYPVQMLDR